MGASAARAVFALCALSLAACASGGIDDRPANSLSGNDPISTNADDGQPNDGRWNSAGGSDHIRLVAVRPSFCYGGAQPPRYVVYPEGRWGARIVAPDQAQGCLQEIAINPNGDPASEPEEPLGVAGQVARDLRENFGFHNLAAVVSADVSTGILRGILPFGTAGTFLVAFLGDLTSQIPGLKGSTKSTTILVEQGDRHDIMLAANDPPDKAGEEPWDGYVEAADSVSTSGEFFVASNAVIERRYRAESDDWVVIDETAVTETAVTETAVTETAITDDDILEVSIEYRYRVDANLPTRISEAAIERKYRTFAGSWTTITSVSDDITKRDEAESTEHSVRVLADLGETFASDAKRPLAMLYGMPGTQRFEQIASLPSK